MYVTFNDIRGCSLLAHDGEELGKLHDLYVDADDWSVRWFVIETGGWLSSNKVLVGTDRVGRLDIRARRLASELRREQIESAPGASSDPPVAESAVPSTVPLPLVGGHGLFLAGYPGMPLPHSLLETAPPAEVDAQATDAAPESADGARDGLGLRSCDELRGYAVAGTDDDIGTVHDLLFDPASWSLGWLEIDTGKWLPGRLVVLSPRWTKGISFADRHVRVALTREQVRDAPAPDTIAGLERAYEERLQLYYGYPML